MGIFKDFRIYLAKNAVDNVEMVRFMSDSTFHVLYTIILNVLFISITLTVDQGYIATRRRFFGVLLY